MDANKPRCAYRCLCGSGKRSGNCTCVRASRSKPHKRVNRLNPLYASGAGPYPCPHCGDYDCDTNCCDDLMDDYANGEMESNQHPTTDSLNTCPCAECQSARDGLEWYYREMRKEAERLEAEYLANPKEVA
jgi:hypothetical protein